MWLYRILEDGTTMADYGDEVTTDIVDYDLTIAASDTPLPPSENILGAIINPQWISINRSYISATDREIGRALHLSPECDIIRIDNDYLRERVNVVFTHPSGFISVEGSEVPRVELDLNGGSWPWMVDPIHMQLHAFLLEPEIQERWIAYINDDDDEETE